MQGSPIWPLDLDRIMCMMSIKICASCLELHNREFAGSITRMDRERRPCRISRRFTVPPSSIGQWTPEHICSLCGKHRSSRYHELHPLAPGQTPEPGICSRPKCAKAVNEMLLRLPYRLVVYEIHHHYHSNGGLEEPPPIYIANEVQLPNNRLYRTSHSSRGLSPIREESPPINTSSELEEPPQNRTVAELSGESSLAGCVELPDNRLCLRRRRFRRLSPIPEESPPPVNLLNKPTLQERK